MIRRLAKRWLFGNAKAHYDGDPAFFHKESADSYHEWRQKWAR